MRINIFNKKTRFLNEIGFGKAKNKNRDIDLISVFSKIKAKANSSNYIDKSTWNDFGMDEIYSIIDRTISKTGQQFLYDKLYRKYESKEHSKIIEAINYFLDNKNEREQKSLLLLKYEKQTSYQFPHILFSKSFEYLPKILYAFSIISLILLVLIPFIDTKIMLLISVILNTGLHYYFKSKILIHKNILANIQSIIQFHRKNHTDLKFINQFKGKEKKKLSSILNKSLFINSNIDSANDLSTIAYYLVELIKGAFLLDSLFYNSLIKNINNNIDLIIRSYENIGIIDSAISIASLKKEYHQCKPPVLNNNGIIQMNNIFHPQIQDCVPNSIDMKAGVLITGGNMSGKSTLLKSIGLNILLSQTINFSFSSSSNIPTSTILSSIKIEDNISKGVSYFYEELIRMAKMIELTMVDHDHLIIIDELFKGTNTNDRLALGISILEYFAKNKSLIIVSTHDIELISYLDDYYQLFYFDHSTKDKMVIPDFRLKRGIQEKSNAITIADSMGFPEDILNKAKEIKEMRKEK